MPVAVWEVALPFLAVKSMLFFGIRNYEDKGNRHTFVEERR